MTSALGIIKASLIKIIELAGNMPTWNALWVIWATCSEY